jgi:hypothetical protein
VAVVVAALAVVKFLDFARVFARAKGGRAASWHARLVAT